MSSCGRSAPGGEAARAQRPSPSRNYACMRKGVGVGRNVKLPRGYVPERVDPREDMYCGERRRAPSGKHKGDPLGCFRKGFGIGKKLQYGRRRYRTRENFADEDLFAIEHNSRSLLLAFLVMLIVFGLLFVVEVYWAWSLLIGVIAGALFWYFCAI